MAESRLRRGVGSRQALLRPGTERGQASPGPRDGGVSGVALRRPVDGPAGAPAGFDIERVGYRDGQRGQNRSSVEARGRSDDRTNRAAGSQTRTPDVRATPRRAQPQLAAESG